jgi:APA family basic amino acid/polyamine antiporter
MGLGSIIGTGVFVSIGTAVEISGWGVVLAIALSAFVAVCNGLNSAQLAASHPVSGGTYEYGYKYLNSWWGFSAGWLFLLAKSASAATAALGFAGYFTGITGIEPQWQTALAVAVVVGFTAIAALGISRSNLANTIIVSTTLLVLACFVISGWSLVFRPSNPISQLNMVSILQATALMFVAYTGYGRIATMGEEVINPRRTIPRAMVITLGLSMTIYMLVSIVGVAGGIRAGSAPLAQVAQQFPFPYSSQILAIGAITAMLGVLLNLILGLSRVLLAMARRKDMPAFLAQINQSGTSPVSAVLTVGLGIALLTLLGNVKTTWSFSAFNVLIYYGITNLSALRLPQGDRLYSKWLSWAGLFACFFLAFWVEWHIWLAGLGWIAVGLAWHGVAQALKSKTLQD